MKTNTKGLGPDQVGFLTALVAHHSWYGTGFGCGWNWGTPSQTLGLCASLQRRGLVVEAAEDIGGRTRTVYRASAAGAAHVAALTQKRREP